MNNELCNFKQINKTKRILFQWSYGVVLWEIFTFGLQPYDGIDNKDIKFYLKEGNRLERPLQAPHFM